MAYGKSRLTNPEVKRLELAPLDAATHELLRHTQRQLQRVANHCVMAWLIYHERRGSLLRLEQGLPVGPCPPELCAQWLREGQALCPDVHSATVLAVTNWLAQTFTSQKSPRVNGKRWLAVLRRDEAPWSYREPLPIRLWSGNCKIERREGGVAVVARVDRRLVAGKSRAESTPLPLLLRRPKQSGRTAGHRLAYLAAAEIADQTRRLAQSQIAWDGRLRKWFLFLTVDGPAPQETALRDAAAVLAIRPGRQGALRIHADRLSGEFGEEALDRVARVRRRIDERRAGYRAEHDGEPPRAWLEHLAGEWRRQSGSICDALVAEVVRALRPRQFGRVLWLDGNNRRCALARAGLADDRDPRELFPFEQLRRKAQKRLGELGVEVVERANFRSVKRRKQERRKRLVESR